MTDGWKPTGKIQTLNNSVRGWAKVSRTSFISDQSSLDLNSWRYLWRNNESNRWKCQHQRLKSGLWGKSHLLKRECAVRRTPLMIWKSPLLKRVTISVRRSGHFWGKSSLPMMLMASLNCRKSSRVTTHSRVNTSFSSFQPTYLLLYLLWAAEHQIHNVGFDGCSVGFWDFVRFIFNLWEPNHSRVHTSNRKQTNRQNRNYFTALGTAKICFSIIKLRWNYIYILK